jgi:hypothetical protein
VTVACRKCGATLSERAAGIAVLGHGDEYIHTYFLCARCDAWTVEVFHDAFMGESSVWTRGPLSRAEGDADVERIRRCPSPGDKTCGCETYRGW